MVRLLRAFCLAVLATFLSTAHASAVAMFTGLGDLPGGAFRSQAFAISADGSSVTGRSQSAAGPEAFRWTASAGIEALGDVQGNSFGSHGKGISGDGSVVVGQGSGDNVAVRWTAVDGFTTLDPLSIANPGGAANAVSNDGTLAVGFSDNVNNNAEAVLWNQLGAVVGFGDLAGGTFHSAAFGLSPDGSVVVGFGNSDSGQEAFRWTEQTGMIGLGDHPGEMFPRLANAVSADGSVVVGWGHPGTGSEAFRWTDASGVIGLGVLNPDVFNSSALAVSADGRIVVGTSRTNADAIPGIEAFIWDASNGMRNLRDVLINDFGLDLTGWTLEQALGISADGFTITGFGINPIGDTEAWIAVIPEPSTALLLASGLVALAVGRRSTGRGH